MTDASLSGTETAWRALGGDPRLLSRVSVVARDRALPARLPVRELARASVAACALAAAELASARTGREVPAVRVDDGAVATAFVSERHLLVDGRAPVAFAELSRFWRTADGWVRTHANYPHHRARLLSALGLTEGDAPVERVAAVLAGRTAQDVEDEVAAAGGLAVALRTAREWAAHPQGAAVAARPLLDLRPIDGSPPGTSAFPARRLPPLVGDPLLPASGVRVLDLTRVIAGPVATRTLALLGADVLRVDPPGLPELPDQHTDTGFGKRSTRLDLGDPRDRAAFEELLPLADVVVTGYRPGALDRFGLAPEALAERRPGLVVAQLSAWGDSGPWAGRRGFDSLVQVATGIAVAERSTDQPGALPAQALDHGTGYLLAAAVLRALTEQLGGAGALAVRPVLARTAHWLLHDLAPEAGRTDAGQTDGGQTDGGQKDAGQPHAGQPHAAYDPDHLSPWLTGTDSALGELRYARPPVAFDGAPDDWARPPGPWGTDDPVWGTGRQGRAVGDT
ncbi:CoA transferase [Streptomyces sp. NPDC006638]|uniref:CoA transferase n=1 Tax=Streptomyces sp. NPDC006638 TaxID=3157183 RepID=UPI0033AF5D25